MEVWNIISPETFTMMGRKKKLKNYKKKERGWGRGGEGPFDLSALDEKLTAMEKENPDSPAFIP